MDLSGVRVADACQPRRRSNYMATTREARLEESSWMALEQPTGLHGHRLDVNVATAAVAEFLGTFGLVLAITATVMGAALARPVVGTPYGSLAVPLAGGLALTCMVAAFGHISGAHFNPAVTLGLAVTGKFRWRQVPVYLISQLLGAIGAALACWLVYGEAARKVAHLGATYPAARVGTGAAFAVEAIVTFLLVIVIMAVATDNRVPTGVAAVAIGFALTMAIFISGPISGASVNPVRSLGPMIVAGKFTDWWLYIVAPILGGIVAGVTYNGFLRKGNGPLPMPVNGH
jgi:MIP family channel proteins